MLADNSIRLDVAEVLRKRVPRLSRLIPTRMVRWLERTICQDEMNRLLEENRGLTGADFCRGVLGSLKIGIDVRNAERLPAKEDRRVVFVSNHPLGGLDGMALIDVLQNHFGGQIWFIVNDLLMAIKPLNDVFLPINKHGAQSRRATAAIEEAFAGNDPVIIFPAGLCSRLHKSSYMGKRVNTVADLKWHKMFVNKAIQHHRDIMPLHFSGQNSDHFYKVARNRKLLRIPFNIEMVYLPQEVFKARGKRFTITVGARIPWNSVAGGKDAQGSANSIRSLTYLLDDDSVNPPINLESTPH